MKLNGRKRQEIQRRWAALSKAVNALPEALKSCLRRYLRIFLAVPPGCLIVWPVMGWRLCGLFFIGAEAGLSIWTAVQLRKFLSGGYLFVTGEIVKLERERLWGRAPGRKMLMLIRSLSGQTAALKLEPREGRRFSAGDQVEIYAAGGHRDRFGIIMLWGYYAIVLAGEKET